ncbi:MAG: MBL fold metallo-hydrolase [Gudongella sp.]|nr:MBL fold metallo-hydrolase [Gudongella sp.]
MKIKRIQAGIYAANCYIIYTEGVTREAVIVDPGGDYESIIKEINKKELRVKYIVLTHGHGDHIGAVIAVKKHFDVPVMIHKADMEMVKDHALNLSGNMAMGAISFEPDILLKDGESIEFGDEYLKVIHTPGHTKGGICLYSPGLLITGDTLFEGSIGRTDLYGGDYDTLMRGIKNKLLQLPEDTIIYPGHGGQSTLKKEKLTNPFLRKM